jgi:hypothetical protein
MRYFNGRLEAERPYTPYEPLQECTDCSMVSCDTLDHCQECGEPLCQRCATACDDIPMCTECHLTYVTLTRMAARKRKLVAAFNALHNETMHALEVYS